MGCDIHMHVEIKILGRREWEHYSQPDVERNYALFAKMAGVRNRDENIEPIALPRGLPKDVSFMTQYASDFDGSDGHSHSYLESAEVAMLEKWYRTQSWAKPFGFYKQFGFLFGNSFDGFAQGYRDCYPATLEDFRFVFWFDN